MKQRKRGQYANSEIILSEFQKLIEGHKGLSPLKDDAETF